MGAVSPLGRDTATLWAGLTAGLAAFKPVTLFDASPFRNNLVGEVDGYPPYPGREKCGSDEDTAGADRPPRSVRMLSDAAAEALREALSLPPTDGNFAELREAVENEAAVSRAAVVCGTNFGGLDLVREQLAAEEAADLSPALFGAAGAKLAAVFGLSGPRFNLSLSCASGTAAIGVGLRLIRTGKVQAVLACGYDELALFCYAGLSALRAITPDLVRPFDRRRQGTLFSEGAGAVLLEEKETARARGARARAVVRGAAENNDAYHMTAPDKEERGRITVVRAALADAECAPDETDLFNLHATGTRYNDVGEARVLHEVFGKRAAEVPVAAVKSTIGHTMGAAGVLETIVAVRSLETGLTPPILGLDLAEKDPECDLLTPVGAPARGEFRTVLKLSAGFGGTNAALVLSSVEDGER